MSKFKIPQLLDSDLPQRIEAARKHSTYDLAMAFVPIPPSVNRLIAAILLLAFVAAAPLIGIAIAPRPPVVLLPLFVVIAAGLCILMVVLWRFHRDMRSAPVRREVCAVLKHLRMRTGSAYTLWNPTMLPRTVGVQGGPLARYGDVGVAIFRGEHLAAFIPVPVGQ